MADMAASSSGHLDDVRRDNISNSSFPFALLVNLKDAEHGMSPRSGTLLH